METFNQSDEQSVSRESSWFRAPVDPQFFRQYLGSILAKMVHILPNQYTHILNEIQEISSQESFEKCPKKLMENFKKAASKKCLFNLTTKSEKPKFNSKNTFLKCLKSLA